MEDDMVVFLSSLLITLVLLTIFGTLVVCSCRDLVDINNSYYKQNKESHMRGLTRRAKMGYTELIKYNKLNERCRKLRGPFYNKKNKARRIVAAQRINIQNETCAKKT